jgi:hypothetical protein
MVSVNTYDHSVSVFAGQGDGTFAPHTTYAVGMYPQAAAIGDLNHDGVADIAVVNDGSNSVSVLLGARVQ